MAATLFNLLLVHSCTYFWDINAAVYATMSFALESLLFAYSCVQLNIPLIEDRLIRSRAILKHLLTSNVILTSIGKVASALYAAVDSITNKKPEQLYYALVPFGVIIVYIIVKDTFFYAVTRAKHRTEGCSRCCASFSWLSCCSSFS